MASQAPTLVPMGGLLMTIMTEGVTPQQFPTETQLRTWNARANAPFSMVLDSQAPQARMEAYFNRPRDTYILIDLSTMRILSIISANVQGALSNLRARLE